MRLGGGDSYDYAFDLMPRIGQVIIWFNALELGTDHTLYWYILDRFDMMYSTKVGLFEKGAADFFHIQELSADWFPRLISNLRECGTLQNKVVHAIWLYADQAGYTQVKIRFGKQVLEHEPSQFSKESMDLIIGKIEAARNQFDYFDVEFLQ